MRAAASDTRGDGDAMSAAITVAAVPKAFDADIGRIQRNALGSWRRLPDVSNIILLGDEHGLPEVSRQFGAERIGDIPCDEEGAPQLDAVFRAVDRAAATEWICYVNADIILLPDFWAATQRAIATLGPSLSVSRRWNLEVPYVLSFGDGWVERLRRAARTEGELFTPFALDIFVYPRGVFTDMPPFSVGAFSWDNWLLHEARARGLPIRTSPRQYEHHPSESRLSRFQQCRCLPPQSPRPAELLARGGFAAWAEPASDATHVLRQGEIVPADTKTASVVISTPGAPTGSPSAWGHSSTSYPRTYIEVIVATEAGKLRQHTVVGDFPFVKQVRAAARGRSAARNKGAAVASGELLAFLDSDVMPAGDWVENLVADSFRTTPTALLRACRWSGSRTVARCRSDITRL